MRGITCLALLLFGVGCGSSEPAPATGPAKATAATEPEVPVAAANEGPSTKAEVADEPKLPDLATARSRFSTRVRKEGPAPQAFGPVEPVPGFREVKYTSGELDLKGWLSEPPGEERRRPAVVYLHGGWALDASDLEAAAPFAKAGFVLFAPTLRAENGNPGTYQAFYGEVDDVIAAGKYVAGLPSVDSEQVFLAGHSAGAVLAVLVAMMPSPYRSAVALDGYLDMQNWVRFSTPEQVIFDLKDPEEVRLRDPMQFAHSLQIPLDLIVTAQLRGISERFDELADDFAKRCFIIQVPGDHLSMLEPGVNRAIGRFVRHGAKLP